MLALIAGCQARQPESAKTVAAFEVPLPSEADRARFLSDLRAAPKFEGMHVDAMSNADLAMQAQASPTVKMTLNAGVWRGSNDDDSIAVAIDQYDHLGQFWLMFWTGKDPASSARFRERVMHTIMLHWPDTLPLPIMPNGSIPLHHDLIRTSNGYIVDPSQAYRYSLQPTETRSQ